MVTAPLARARPYPERTGLPALALRPASTLRERRAGLFRSKDVSSWQAFREWREDPVPRFLSPSGSERQRTVPAPIPAIDSDPRETGRRRGLPGTSRRATKDGMWVLARRFILLLAVLAFAVGLPLALAIPPAMAALPCPHKHHHDIAGEGHDHHHAPAKPSHRHDAAGCLCCCAAACVAIPDLVRGNAIAVLFATTAVVYTDTMIALSGRSLRPDPAPPRSRALS